MKSQRRPGLLWFKGPDLVEHLQAYWELRSGKLAEGKTWIASVSFSPDWVVPEKARTLVFTALADPEVKVRLGIDRQTTVSCVVYDILELVDCGAILVASPDLGGAKSTYRCEL